MSLQLCDLCHQPVHGLVFKVRSFGFWFEGHFACLDPVPPDKGPM